VQLLAIATKTCIYTSYRFEESAKSTQNGVPFRTVWWNLVKSSLRKFQISWLEPCYPIQLKYSANQVHVQNILLQGNWIGSASGYVNSMVKSMKVEGKKLTQRNSKLQSILYLLNSIENWSKA